MARSFSQEARSDSQKIGETRYRMSHLPSTTAIARTLLLAGILLAVFLLMSRSFVPAFALETDTIDYLETRTDNVAVYTTTDPEMGEITWSLTSGDTDDLSIDSATGVLTFKEQPDFEAPTGGSGNDSTIYSVTAIAKDPTDTESDQSRRTVVVTVNLMNANEDGDIQLSTLQPLEDVPFTATLTDIDGGITATTTWHWERRNKDDGPDDWSTATTTTHVPNPITNEVASLPTTYTPVAEDIDHFLRVTASYTDAQGPDKSIKEVSANFVLKNLLNDDPVFQDDEGEPVTELTRSVAEDASEGAAVGAPVEAYDDDGDTLTYELDDGDAQNELFTIDRGTGQIRVGADVTLDRESTPDSFTVTVSAYDPSRRQAATVTVTITETDVPEAPSIDSGPSRLSLNEITEAQRRTMITRDGVVDNSETLLVDGRLKIGDYTGSDDDDRANPNITSPLTWTLKGNDGADFIVCQNNSTTACDSPTGLEVDLLFLELPDYEAKRDSNTNNEFHVTLVATDSAGTAAEHAVVVTVGNIDEGGTISFSHVTPEIDSAITASIADPDGRVTGQSWQWYRNNQTTEILGATSNSYTPDSDDVNAQLFAGVTYTDPHGGNKMAISDNNNDNNDLNTVIATSTKMSPSFKNADRSQDITSEQLNIDEHTGENSPILSIHTWMLDDPDSTGNDSHVYSLSSSVGSYLQLFELTSRTSGRIRLVSGAMLDHETQPRGGYALTLTAKDPSNKTDSITIYIDVNDVQEAPSIEGGDNATVEYAELKNGNPNTDNVHTFKATDPEDNASELVWTLDDGADIALFDLTDNGVLSFKTPRNFEESEAADTNNPDKYIVEVRVIDTGEEDGSNPLPDTQTLTVEIVNIDEGGEVELDTLQPLEGVDLIATLRDIDEGITATTTWHWERRHEDSRSWTTSTTTTSFSSTGQASLQTTYTPVAEDVDHFLRLTVTYTDAEGPDKDEEVESANFVLKDLVYEPPVFQDDAGTATTSVTRAVPENSPENTAVGAPVAAFDEDGDNLTYELVDPTIDNVDILALFKIDRDSGQIRVLADLDHEQVDEYTVTVIAKDPSDGLNDEESRDDVSVTISVTDEPEDPTFSSGPEEIKVTEITLEHDQATITRDGEVDNSPVQPNQGAINLATYLGDDEDEDDVAADLRWSLTGHDADSFTMSTTTSGTSAELILILKASPDFEAPADSDGDNTYDVTVNLFDDGRRTAARDVAVTVENQPEMGVVTLSNAQPEVGTEITADLEDPDGGVTGETWQWYWGTTRNIVTNNPDTGWNLIRNATSRSYTPVAGDYSASPGNYLRATVTYTDNHEMMDDTTTTNRDESKDVSHGVSQNTVQEEPQSNEVPQFPDQDDTKSGKQAERSVLENSGAMTAVGTGLNPAVVATDVDQEVLTYTLSGPDASYFTIDMYDDEDTTFPEVPGQIRVAEGTELDYETRKTYTVVVTATDSSGAQDMITVTINVTDVNERPFEIQKRGLTVSGPPEVSYAEDRSDVVGNYFAAGPDAVGASLSLEGDDRSLFTLAANGDLTFNAQPDYEAPASQDGDNTYDLIVMATMGNFTFSQPVIVTVTNVDEPGEVRFTTTPLVVRVGVELAAELDERDEETNVTWQWASGGSDTGSWTPISGETSNTYTPVEADVGDYLQITASYTDATFGSDSVSTVTASAVAAESTEPEEDGVVSFSPSQPVVGDPLEATVTDPDNNESGFIWEWARDSSASGGFTDVIANATSDTYTPVEADAGMYLQATVTYTDDDGDNIARGVTGNSVAIDSYDADADGTINGTEVLNAVRDYFNDVIDGPRVLAVVRLYFRNF